MADIEGVKEKLRKKLAELRDNAVKEIKNVWEFSGGPESGIDMEASIRRIEENFNAIIDNL